MIAVILVLTVTALAALATAVFSLFQARALARQCDCRRQLDRAELSAGIDAVKTSLEGLTVDVRELQASPPPAAGGVRPGLNLSKRSQALRMHRRGESPDRIASELEIPPQEVELLIKVHRIVLGSL